MNENWITGRQLMMYLCREYIKIVGTFDEELGREYEALYSSIPYKVFDKVKYTDDLHRMVSEPFCIDPPIIEWI